MRQYERFSECLKRVMDQQQISASEVARLVGFRSRNSIFRILGDQTSVKVQEEFLNTLQEAVGEQWPEEHWQALRESLEVTRVGVHDYLGRRALWDLIVNGFASEREVMVDYALPKGEFRQVQLRPMVRELVKMGRVDMVICGCCNVPLLSMMAEEFSASGEKGMAHVRHYVYGSEQVVVQNIATIQPIFRCKWYEPLLVEPGCCPKEMEALYSAGMVCVKLTEPDGKTLYRQLLMHDEDRLFLTLCGDQAVEDIMRLLDHYAPGMAHLKAHFPTVLSHDDYVEYTQTCLKMEYKRDIYSIKPDPSISYIHPDILLPAAVDGFRESDFVDQAPLESLVQKFYDVHLHRHQNFTQKRKVTYAVFSLQAMRAFMLTGRQSDHFFAMRPYTVAERLAFLNFLRDQMLRNPYFTVRFLKADVPTPKMEITLYEGKGVMFTKAYTDYDLANGEHAEALITHPGFARKYREFFLHELLPKYVMSSQETLAAMDELARLAAEKG